MVTGTIYGLVVLTPFIPSLIFSNNFCHKNHVDLLQKHLKYNVFMRVKLSHIYRIFGTKY